MSEELLVVGQGELDRVDGVELVRRRREVPGVLVLRPVVSAARDPPGAAGGGLELAEVQLPELVRPGRLDRERGLPTLGELAAAAREVFGEDVDWFHEDDEGEHPGI